MFIGNLLFEIIDVWDDFFFLKFLIIYLFFLWKWVKVGLIDRMLINFIVLFIVNLFIFL